MNAELEYQLIKSHVNELQRNAAKHRRIKEAREFTKPERRSIFGKRHSSES